MNNPIKLINMQQYSNSNRQQKAEKLNSQKNKIPDNLLISFAAATVCSAFAVKFLKKGELAMLTTFLFIPVALMLLNKTDKKCCRKNIDINPIL